MRLPCFPVYLLRLQLDPLPAKPFPMNGRSSPAYLNQQKDRKKEFNKFRKTVYMNIYISADLHVRMLIKIVLKIKIFVIY